jgi:glycosyltransferase involved in cell wall biosynthesis
MADGREWPRITVITPNLNYGRFIEETVRSVLLQGYPNLEYIVIDGGSDDESLPVIERYAGWLHWESCRDGGQSHAINKGLQRATGDIVAFLNSDDSYEPHTLARVASLFESRRRCVIMGDVNEVDGEGRRLRVWRSRTPTLFPLLFQHRLCRIGGITAMPNQPAVFWGRQVSVRLGGFREDLRFGFDYEYWLRLLTARVEFHRTDDVFANYRFHGASLSAQGWSAFYPDWQRVSSEYLGRLPAARRLQAELWWWCVLLPWSMVTLPFRAMSYLSGVKRA